MPDINSAMGTGGSSSIFSRKTELVADLTSAFKELNRELQKTKDLSDAIAKNLKNAKPGGGAGSIADTSSNSTGTKSAIENDGSQGGGMLGKIGNFFSKVMPFVGKAAGAALQAMPTIEEVMSQNISASQAGFASGRGLGFGMRQQMGLATQGTFGSTQDVYEAQRLMTQYGMQGKNSQVFQANVAAMSNLVPTGNGADAARAVQALNQAKNVNMLRMIGVNVRGADGMMRGMKDIAKDLWSTLNKQKMGGKPLSKDDISFSLQPGNALDSLLNQYFGNDPVLRQGVVNELLLMAGGSGGAITKQVTQQQGLSTSAINSKAALTATQVNVQQAAAQYELKGFEEANKALGKLNTRFAELIDHSKVLQKILEGKGFMDTFAGAGHGAGSAVLGMAGAGLMGIGKWGLGKAKGLFNWGKGAADDVAGKAKGFGSKALGPISALLSGYFGFQDRKKNKGKFDWGSVAKSAGTAFVAGEVVGGAETFGLSGLIAALVAGGGNIAGQLIQGGEGGGEDGLDPSSPTMPLSNNPPITSPFGVVRHIITDPKTGRHNASWGKPHGGVDFGVPEGTPVFAVKDGVAQETPYDSNGFGNYAKVLHEDGKMSYYGHLSSILAKGGQKVSAGDLVGYSGNTGNSSGPHLHFEVRENNQSIDPLSYIANASEPNGANSAHPIKKSGLKITGGAGELMLQPVGGEGDVPATTYSNVKAQRAGTGQTINYGGVTVTMNFPAGTYNKTEIKEAVREVLSYDNIRKHAVSK